MRIWFLQGLITSNECKWCGRLITRADLTLPSGTSRTFHNNFPTDTTLKQSDFAIADDGRIAIARRSKYEILKLETAFDRLTETQRLHFNSGA